MHEALIAEFWSRHGVTNPRAPFLAEPAIIALDSAHPVFAAAFGDAPEPKDTSGMILCALENLSNRLYEQAAGMLVCLGTGSAAAAETVARTVIEGAFNFQFIASQSHEARLFAFFCQYLKEHDRKLREWKNLEGSKTQTPEQAVILKGISERLSTHQKMSEFVKSLGEGLGFECSETVLQHWPSSLYKRCEQIAITSRHTTA